MTVSTTTVKINAPGDGIQTNFPYDFKIIADSHLKVYYDNVLQGTGGYIVNGAGDEAGGSVDFTVPPANGVIVTLYRLVPDTQESDYEPYRDFPAGRVEDDYDLAAMRDQQLGEENDRAVRAPINDDGTFDYTLPAIAAGKGIKANATGDAFIETTYDPDAAQTDSAANVVLTNADVVSTNADVVLCDAAVVDAEAAAVAAAASAATVLTQVEVDIGDWDMDATPSVAVAHGLADYTKVRAVSVMVRDDTESSLYQLATKLSATGGGVVEGGTVGITSTLITLNRETGGAFDDPNFNATGYNRGWLLFTLAN